MDSVIAGKKAGGLKKGKIVKVYRNDWEKLETKMNFWYCECESYDWNSFPVQDVQ